MGCHCKILHISYKNHAKPPMSSAKRRLVVFLPPMVGWRLVKFCQSVKCSKAACISGSCAVQSAERGPGFSESCKGACAVVTLQLSDYVGGGGGAALHRF